MRIRILTGEDATPMKVTQQDIARLAKVSQSTVSRVISDDPKVEKDIKQRVIKAIQTSNYKVDFRARNLRNRRNHLIGLVINRPSGSLSEDPFFSSLVAEIIDFLRGTPYHLCLDATSGDDGQEFVYDELLRTRRVDGLILVESEARDQRIEKLMRDNFPFVLIGNPLGSEHIYSVDNDNVLAGESATRHLLDQGYTRVGILGARIGVTVSDDRIAGYQRAVRGRQSEHLIWHSEFGLDSARETSTEVLGSKNRPDALVVIDDYMAMGVLHAAQEFKIHIPNDLGLVSFNDSNLCNLLDGGMSSMSLRIHQLVTSACERLLQVIEGGNFESDPRIVVPCELKIRGSSLRGNKVS